MNIYINPYDVMWLFVFFDLPVVTKKQRKEATAFRKELLKDGFAMKQYSVYMRDCASREIANVHKGRVKKWLPLSGKVSILEVTDKQFGLMTNFVGTVPKENPKNKPQLQLF